MFKKIFTVALLAAFLVVLPHHIGAQEDATADAGKALQAKIAKLIEQLGSEKFEERKVAGEELLDIGEDAREALEKATKNPDTETAAAAAAVLKQLDMLRFVFVCTDEKGAPLKGQTLFISIKISRPRDPDEPYTEPGGIEKSGKIAEDGTFSLEPFDGEVVEITAEIEGFAPIRSRELKFQGGKYVIPLRFVLAGTIKGVVVDAGNKDAPLPDANVTIGENHTTTDEKGRFEIKGVPPGSHQVYVWKEQMEQETRPQAIDVASGKTSEVKVRMVRKDEAGPCEGFKCKLLKPDGKPLANTRVVVEMEVRSDDTTYHRSFGEERWGTLPVTDTDGCLLFGEIENGQVTLKICVAGYKPVEIGEHEVKPGESWEIKEPIKLDRGLEIEVVVRDAAGKPIPDAKVITRAVEDGYKYYRKSQMFADEDDNAELPEAAPSEEPVPPQEKKPNLPGITDTNDEGVAKVTGLPGGDIAVVAVKNGYVVSGQKTVTLKKGETKKIEITLEKEATAEVRIIDADTKQPVLRARVSVERDFSEQSVIGVESESYSRPGRRDESTTRKIRGIRAGKAAFSASARGYHNGTVEAEFKPGEKKQITVEMKKLRDGALAGTIKPAPTVPMSEIFCALLYCSEPDSGYGYGYGETPIVLRLDRKGRFNVPNVQEGRWGIIVLGMNDRPIVKKDFEIKPDKTAELSLQLEALGTLEIELVDHEGKPVAGTELGLFQQGHFSYGFAGESHRFFRSDGLAEAVMTDENGRCRVEHLIPSVYLVSIRRAGPSLLGVGQIWKTNIKADKTEKLKIRMAKTTTLEGTVLLKGNKQCSVIVFKRDASFLEIFLMPVAMLSKVTTGKKFTLKDIPPGKHTIMAVQMSDSFMSSYLKEIDVKEGVPVKGIELKFPEKAQKVYGRVISYKRKGRPEEGVLLMGPVMAGAELKPDGRFEAKAVPGKYKVFHLSLSKLMARDDSKIKPLEIEVEEGKDLTGVEIP